MDNKGFPTIMLWMFSLFPAFHCTQSVVEYYLCNFGNSSFLKMAGAYDLIDLYQLETEDNIGSFQGLFWQNHSRCWKLGVMIFAMNWISVWMSVL